MQASRFDAFTKRLATASSRRGALQLLGGGLAGGVLAALRRRPAAAGFNGGGSPTITTIRFVTPEPSTCGQATTIAFAVMSAGLPLPLGATPTGTVTISDGVQSCTGPLAPFSPFFPGYAVGSCTISFTTLGPRSLTATYSGDGTFAPSTSLVPWPHTVVLGPGQTACGTAPNQTCCVNGQTTCVAGTCCANAQVCGTAPNQTCCVAGVSTCVGGTCCPAGQVCGTVPTQTCCVAGQSTCVGGACCPTAQLCGSAPNQTCCLAGTTCVAGACCPNPQVCGPAPNQTCCVAGVSTCVAGACCPNAQVCGSGPSATCGCPPGENCIVGMCRGPIGTCAAGANSCTGTLIRCNMNPGCFCFQTTELQTVCAGPTVLGTCTTSADCGTGRVCVVSPIPATSCAFGPRTCHAICT